MYLKSFLKSRKLAHFVIGGIALLGLNIVEMPHAQANAHECIGTGSSNPSTQLPSSSFCFNVYGTGVSVNEFAKYTVSLGGMPVCNFRFKVYWNDCQLTILFLARVASNQTTASFNSVVTRYASG